MRVASLLASDHTLGAWVAVADELVIDHVALHRRSAGPSNGVALVTITTDAQDGPSR
jgi:hypothetical protein